MPTIERIGPDEWERARAIRVRALDDSADAFFVTAEQESASTPAEWRQRLERPDAVTFIASVDGADVGLVVGSSHHQHEGDAGLYAMWVDPQARGTGVAEALIGEVIEWALAAGYRSLRLDVGDENPSAIGLYARLGFEPTGARFTFPHPREHITEHERALVLDR
ncbi:MAG: GNAT family N-acetyltransferase [Egibacteraceae bacterium]